MRVRKSRHRVLYPSHRLSSQRLTPHNHHIVCSTQGRHVYGVMGAQRTSAKVRTRKIPNPILSVLSFPQAGCCSDQSNPRTMAVLQPGTGSLRPRKHALQSKMASAVRGCFLVPCEAPSVLLGWLEAVLPSLNGPTPAG